jgi:PIN domain nuclease of toxin-antitoxin system
VSVFDASALLAYLRGEAGSGIVRSQLELGGFCGAANWSEVAQKVSAAGADWNLARGLLLSYALTIEQVTAEDAEAAAALWHAGSGLSLGDRLCLALGQRLDATVMTADRAWMGLPGVELVR